MTLIVIFFGRLGALKLFADRIKYFITLVLKEDMNKRLEKIWKGT